MRLGPVSSLASRVRNAIDKFLFGHRYYVTCPRGNYGVTVGVRRLEVSDVKKDAVLFFGCSGCCSYRDSCSGPHVERLLF